MPEMPEVETIRRSLEGHLVQRKVSRLEVCDPHAVRYPTAAEAVDEIAGQELVRLERRGKYFLFRFKSQRTLVLHLRMSGRLIWHEVEMGPERFTRLRFHLDDRSILDFLDMRRLGGVYLPAPDGRGTPPGLLHLGPEPLTGSFTARYLEQTARERRTTVKAFLLDQHVVAGLGNIYVDEALHRAGIHPARRALHLSPAEWQSVQSAIRDVLRDGLTMRGVSFSLYVDGLGRRGAMTEHLRVYGRGGKPCLSCGTPLTRIRQGGRGTTFCALCQPIDASSVVDRSLKEDAN